MTNNQAQHWAEWLEIPGQFRPNKMPFKWQRLEFDMAGVIKMGKDGSPRGIGRLRANGVKTTPKGTTPKQQARRRTTPTRYRKEK